MHVFGGSGVSQVRCKGLRWGFRVFSVAFDYVSEDFKGIPEVLKEPLGGFGRFQERCREFEEVSGGLHFFNTLNH